MEESCKIKKIGILTFVRSYNYGTLMQAYATQKILQNFFGDRYYVEIVNIRFWKNTLSQNHKLGKLLRLRSPKMYLDYYRRKRAHLKIISFFTANVQASPQYTSSDFNDCVEYLKKQNYDILISGSDEIWSNKAKMQIPNIFFIPPELNTIKLSLATSANRGDFDLLTKDQREYISKSISAYDYLAVRDKNTQDIIEKITGRKPHLMFDPTLACEFPQIDYKGIHANRIKNSKKKIMALMLRDKRIANEIITKYKNDYLIVSVVSRNDNTLNLSMKNPMQFASIFKHFDLVVTDFFHGTAFCIKNNVPFISIDSEEIYKKYESKIADMLDRLGLKNHYLPVWNHNMDEYLMLHHKINELINTKENTNFSNVIDRVVREYHMILNDIQKEIDKCEGRK